MTKHNLWSISIITILFALLFTPMIVAGSLYFPYVTGKVFAFRFGVSLAAICWLILVLKRPEYMPKRSGIIAVSGIFVVWLVVANAFGIDPANSFFSNFERMEGWFTHAYLFAYLVVLSSVLRTDRLWNWLLGTSVVIANVISLAAAFGDELRTSVFLGNSTYVAIYIFFNLYFAALLAYRLAKVKTKERGLRYAGLTYYGASILLFIYIIFRTQTRGTALALAFSVAGFFVLSAITHWRNRRVRIASIGLFAAAVLGMSLFWMNRDAQFIQRNPLLVRVATISASEGTGKARLMNWGIALEGIRENPVLGWGQENYMYVFPTFYNPGMYGQEPWFDRTHNALLDWAIQGGLVAVALYLALFAFALVALYRSASLSATEKNILAAMFAGYAIHNLFVFDNYSSYLMFFTALGLVVHHQHAGNVALPQRQVLSQVSATVAIILIVIAGYVVILKPFGVARGIISIYKSQTADDILARYEKIFEKDTFGNFEATTRFLSDSSNFLAVKDPAFQQRYLESAKRVGEKSIADMPKSVRALEFYGNFLLQTGNTKEAITVLERARELAPNRQNNLYALGFSYLSEKQFDKAVEILKHAYEVAPENAKARNYYGAALLLAGDKSGEALIADYAPNDSFILSVFNSTGRFKQAVAMLETQVAAQPTNYQLQVSLAVAQYRSGNSAKAIEIIRNVIKMVPEFKTQGETIIRDIQAGRNPIK